MAFTYDVFISYSSEDRAWASRLADDLSARNLRVFLDRHALRAGPDWDPQLRDALTASQHLVLLWSTAARESDWVDEERGTFRQFVRERAAGAPPRYIIAVMLDRPNNALSRFQVISDVLDAGAYAEGADAIDAGLWRGVVEKVERSVTTADAATPVPVLLVTTTRDRMEHEVDPDEAAPDGPSLNELIAELKIPSRDKLLESYGPRRWDWRPFGSSVDIHGLLDELKDAINRRLDAARRPRFRWEYLDDEFWSSAPDEAARRLQQEAGIIVVDPLSLYDRFVANRVANWLARALQNPDAFFLVLAPYSLPPTADALRRTIRALARPMVDSFYDPPVFTSPRFARCAASVGDKLDFEAWLLTGIGPRLAAPPQSGGLPYLQTGPVLT